jgi:2-isopropylmalate synthase
MDATGKELTAQGPLAAVRARIRRRDRRTAAAPVIEEDRGAAANPPWAERPAWDGEVHAIEGRGNGPIDAFTQA